MYVCMYVCLHITYTYIYIYIFIFIFISIFEQYLSHAKIAASPCNDSVQALTSVLVLVETSRPLKLGLTSSEAKRKVVGV